MVTQSTLTDCLDGPEVLRLVADTASSLIVYVDQDCRYAFVNKTFLDFFSVLEADVIGKPVWEVLGSDIWKIVCDDFGYVLTGHPLDSEYRVTLHGKTHWLRTSYLPHQDRKGIIKGFAASSTFETVERELNSELQDINHQFSSLMRNSPLGIFKGRLIYQGKSPVDYEYLAINETFRGMVNSESIVGERFSTLKPLIKQSHPELLRFFARAVATRAPEKHEFFNAERNHWYDLIAYGLGGERFVCVVQENTEIKKYEQQLRQLETYDSLTGLPNRKTLSNRLRQLLEKCVRDGSGSLTYFPILFIELDGIGAVNESLGHRAGDELLNLASQRMREALPDNAVIGRWEAHEFLVMPRLMPSELDAVSLARQLLATLTNGFEVLDDLASAHRIFIGAAIGIAFGGRDGDSVSTLVRSASSAMYDAKRKSGAHGMAEYSPALTEFAHTRLRLYDEIRRGIDQGEFVAHYQPVIDLTTRNIHGAEALVRWRKASGEVVAPAVFLDLAESTGLIDEIGMTVLSQACQAAAKWSSLSAGFRQMAINVSTSQLNANVLERQVDFAFRESRVDPGLIEIEVTESGILENREQAIDALKRFRALGGSVAIDDFGTGHSSLAYIKNLPIDKIKIDRCFVGSILDDRFDQVLVKTIIQLAESLSLKVQAEGIETSQQMDHLIAEGCHLAQGFLIGRPLPFEDFERQWID